MRAINRSALVVRPKEPYIQWALSLDDSSAHLEADLREQFSVYLVARDPEEAEESAPIENYYSRIFELELEEWHLDMDDWPENRDLVTFHEWFSVEAHSLIVDLEDSDIDIELL